MKKVFVVSKTHLDLGFTDYAETIRQKYINEFIPSAINLAEKVNKNGEKNFIWTTGSWILKEALKYSTNENKEKLVNAIKNGNIVSHALPFTTHSELFDKDTFDFGLTIVDEIDKISGKKTVAAKMTDVPGHTKGLVPILAHHGVKLLHIGVNGFSALAKVPGCFLWKCGGEEIIVVYSGDYGGAYKSEFIDEVLYFDHTLDNHGAPSPEKVMGKLDKIRNEYPGYEVCAGTLDEYAEILWKVKDKLPVIEDEIGDTWIQGSAADPYKSASLRELMQLKAQWLDNGTMERMSEEYKNFSDALLCIGEHTCGMDVKTFFADYDHYLKDDFTKARKNDKVTIKRLFSDFPFNILNLINKVHYANKKPTYSTIEKSWSEQRLYIDKAISALSSDHKKQAEEAVKSLRPDDVKDFSSKMPYENAVTFGDFEFELNEWGAIGRFLYKGNNIIKENNEPILEYRSYTSKDYDFFLSHYARNFEINKVWGYPDFARPLLKCVDGKYPAGRFYYKMTNAYVTEKSSCTEICVNLKCDNIICTEAGAPRKLQIVYTLNESGVGFDVVWCGKDANRLTEAIFLHIYPESNDFTLIKTGSEIDYKKVVSMGGKNLHAVEKCIIKNDFADFELINRHSPLLSPGKGKILEYDNKVADIDKDGVSFVLYDNVWGTNFPLWYEDNALFNFSIKLKNK